MPSSEALILDICKQGDSLKMGLFGQGKAVPTLWHYNLVPVSFSELLSLSSELISVLKRPIKDPSSRNEQLKSLQKIGQLFWDHLLSRSIKERLKNNQSCVLTLSLDEELIYLPWELIFDGKDFLCLKFSLGRLVRSRGDSNFLQYRELSDSLKMLVLADPNGDLKSAYNEGLNIKNQFIHKTRKVCVDFKSLRIDRNYVRKYICDYDIVHFAGHCEFNKREFQKSGWVLSDGLFKIEDILRMGQSYSLPALIFSNACHSAYTHKGLIDSEYQKASYGMASAFLYAGVRHYIGAIRKIEDNSSLIFAREFYTRLISGVSVGESLRLSKLKVIKEFGLQGMHWVSYLLYGYPGFVFFGHHRYREKRLNSAVFCKKIPFKSGLTAFAACVIFALAFLLLTFNPAKFYLFLNARSEYRKGDNHAAIVLGEKLAGVDRDFLEIYPIIADSWQRLGEKDKARKYYFQYALRSEKLNNNRHLIRAYIKLGWFYHFDGQYEKARELYEKAVRLSRRMNDKTSEAVVLRKLAVWYMDNGDFEHPLDLLTKSISINLEKRNNFENDRNLACDYFDVGVVFASKNDYAAAKEFYEKSRRIFERLNLRNELSGCYFNLGKICLFEKEYNKALEYYFKGLTIDKQQQNRLNLGLGYNMIGELYMEMDDLAVAEEYFKASADICDAIGSRMCSATVHYNLGLLYKRERRKSLAREHWRKSQEIYRSVDPGRYRQIRGLL
ncbi:MAG: CHAT domain-containing protein, partial [Candidatus Omnitrophica bacterium]|nr:CHAT domain-containing protein [Candidatus Omnitrophota bacterium]